jgi:Integrase core domain
LLVRRVASDIWANQNHHPRCARPPTGSPVWWLRIGTQIERIKPGHPQQNGRHARMHRTLKKETTCPPGVNSLQQQAKFDDFVEEFNRERPHEAVGMKCPADVYTPSVREYRGLPDLSYPFHDRDILVTSCGRICLHRKKINVSTVLAGQLLGIKEFDEGSWLVSFIDYDLGYIDLEQKSLQPLDNPYRVNASARPQTGEHARLDLRLEFVAELNSAEDWLLVTNKRDLFLQTRSGSARPW